MKILFVTKNLSNGGAERVVSILASLLSQIEDVEVAVFIDNRTKGEYSIDNRVSLLSLPDSFPQKDETTKKKIILSLKRFRTRSYCLGNVIDEFQPDFVIPFLNNSIIDAFFAARGKKVSIIPTVRNVPDYRGIKKLLLFFIFHKSEAIYLQTENQKKFLSPKIRHKVFVLPNPIEEKYLSAERTVTKKIEKIVTLGRLVPQKNHKMLIDAMVEVHKKRKNVTLTIYGMGEMEEALKMQIERGEAEEFISLAGRTENVLEVLQEADLFVLTSNYEGMPNALMEAMAVGIPCISTDCPTGPGELLGDNERGILVPMNDSDRLAEVIMNMIDNPDMAYQKGDAARKYITENCASERIAEKLIVELKKLCTRKEVIK